MKNEKNNERFNGAWWLQHAARQLGFDAAPVSEDGKAVDARLTDLEKGKADGSATDPSSLLRL